MGAIPVSLENDLRPLGHCGQRKLHEVVGSNEAAIGKPFMITFPVLELFLKLEYTWSAFLSLLYLNAFLKRLKASSNE